MGHSMISGTGGNISVGAGTSVPAGGAGGRGGGARLHGAGLVRLHRVRADLRKAAAAQGVFSAAAASRGACER